MALMKRRRFLEVSLASLAASACNRYRAQPKARQDRIYLQAALEAARWIRSTQVQTERGVAWPAQPQVSPKISLELYSGVSGVILFFSQLSAATGDPSWMEDARRGADHLVGALPASAAGSLHGLYVGNSGLAFVLDQMAQATGERRYHDGALRYLELVHQGAQSVGAGVQWDDSTDIVFGSAGIGVSLLYAAEQMQHRASLDLARRAGRRLIEVGIGKNGGLCWKSRASAKNVMPNFSHGTAGVAYFLATLYLVTREREFLEAALAGAAYLKSIAFTKGNVCLLFHVEPGGEDRYYLGWCHGPAGTSRLFYQLARATADRQWPGLVERAARGVLVSGIPERRTTGFWNNVSMCCGSAGVADYFLDLYQLTHRREYLDFSRRMTSDLLRHATSDPPGGGREPSVKTKWEQAEFRVKPEFLVAQTGYMQGASGIGTWLLRLDAFEQRRDWKLKLPDSPYPRAS